MPTKRQPFDKLRTQLTLDDLFRQIQKFIGVATAVLERYADISEEVRAIRIAQLADQGALRDHFEEVGREHDELARAIERLERLEILDRTGNTYGVEAQQIRREIKGEHLEEVLRRELAQQIRNLEYVRLKMARFGVNIPTDLVNEAESYQENITRIQQELKDSEAGR